MSNSVKAKTLNARKLSMKTSLSGWIAVVAASAGAVYCSGCGEKPEAADAPAKPVAIEEVLAAEAPEPVSISMPVKPAFTGEVSVVIDKTIEIKRADVDEMADAMFKSNAGMIPPEQADEAHASIRGNVIRQLTLQALLKREADKASVEVADADVDAFFAKASGGRGTMEDVAARSGMSIEKFRSMLTANLRIEKMLDAQVAGLPEPTDEQLKAKFDEIVAANPDALKVPEMVEASHILVKVDETMKDEDAKKKIDEIRAQLLAGTNFAELAKSSSDCPSKERGGSLGKFGRGNMVKEFEEAAFAQEIGAVGEVVKTQFGYHVIRVDAKEPAREIKFEDVKSELLEGVKGEAANKAKSDFVKSVEAAAQIENLEAAVVSEAVQAQPAEAPAEAAPRRVPEWAE